MAQAVIVDTTFWGPSARGVEELERELLRLRRVRSAHAREQRRAVARATVLNLIVYADREAHAQRAARSIAELSLRNPARAIVVLADREPRPGAETRIELFGDLPLPDGAPQVCYEQILVRAHGDVAARLDSAIIPLLVPDLPVFLWWTGTPTLETATFRQLAALADRFVVDSADFPRPELVLPQLARVRADAHGRFSVTDLSWTRLTPWREIVTAFFDVPAWREYLPGIDGLRIGFAVDMDGRAIYPSQALLLVGWLSSRLGWRPREALAPSEAGGLLFRMTRGDGAPIPVRVRPRFERGLDQGDVSGIRLLAERRGERAEFVVKRQPDDRHQTATVLVDGTPRFERTVPLRSPDVIELIGEELAILGSDRAYEDALQALVALT